MTAPIAIPDSLAQQRSCTQLVHEVALAFPHRLTIPHAVSETHGQSCPSKTLSGRPGETPNMYISLGQISSFLYTQEVSQRGWCGDAVQSGDAMQACTYPQRRCIQGIAFSMLREGCSRSQRSPLAEQRWMMRATLADSRFPSITNRWSFPSGVKKLLPDVCRLLICTGWFPKIKLSATASVHTTY